MYEVQVLGNFILIHKETDIVSFIIYGAKNNKITNLVW